MASRIVDMLLRYYKGPTTRTTSETEETISETEQILRYLRPAGFELEQS
jgi:hypothetical protein